VLLPASVMAQGKIAVVNLQAAILQTDEAQRRLEAVRSTSEYSDDKKDYDRLVKEFEDMVQKLQKDAPAMSQDQQISARRQLANKQADLEHVAGKLQKAEQEMAQLLLEELSPRVQQVLQDIIAADGIGLLLQRDSVIHADAGYSITAKVTDRLNQTATN
jgi:outer membrane protein